MVVVVVVVAVAVVVAAVGKEISCDIRISFLWHQYNIQNTVHSHKGCMVPYIAAIPFWSIGNILLG